MADRGPDTRPAPPALSPLPANATIGILGGGQLGRMLSVAAARLGYRCHIYDPGAAPPAGDVAHAVTTAPWQDTTALADFAGAVDVVTYEFENVPTEALDRIEALVPIRPNREALRLSQDRLTEKDFLAGLGLATAPYADVPDQAALTAALDRIGTPAILKTRRLGYDGKGQIRLTPETDPAAAMAALNGAPAILEGFVDFEREVSVIASRGLDGAVAAFDPGENIHRDGILHSTTVPARLGAAQTTDAVLLAARILNALDYVGVLGVELFVTAGGLIVNEIAPRVHNSGHWTQNGCAVDQFEQHIRAVAGWPLGDGQRHSDVVMENLIGDDITRVARIAAEPGAALHLYGKAEARPGRKMGHVNRVKPRG
ncbi:5-(carboxyamino)imidazole ribonucleotide synthase [Frigidibacter sp. ROC022]|uniref:5-(carboxyamino)imidazole ribonucleotide synthase n=1 Tax=Frigidibacter sp. ROC022 TaxID=2971796 RepID=UPI00215AB0EC|nr:5-(carboxyamino)imidazole ribonucleotide synthase [Frigidibacter sp. ROC022]MCR8725843.1 5-(carboxyamino)imidazole ribonucleotide synthase [Frigidibacter sp. ROC022]